jgi:hypothetical protein
MGGRHLRIIRSLFIALVIAIGTLYSQGVFSPRSDDDSTNLPQAASSPAGQAITQIEIKGRAPKTGYQRALFGTGWATIGGCDTRNRILQRDLLNLIFVNEPKSIHCKVASGVLSDPYTGTSMQFVRGEETSDDIQIDHVVALSDAWQKGAQQLSPVRREQFANDPLNLLAVNGKANQDKGDSDAASWLPPNKSYRCAYVARQVAIKIKYHLWMTRSEYDTINDLLHSCPNQILPTS